MVKTKTTVEARAQFAELVNRAAYGHERITLMRRGKGVAAIVPLEDLELLEEIEDKIDLREARKALKEESIPWDQAKKELGLDVSNRGKTKRSKGL